MAATANLDKVMASLMVINEYDVKSPNIPVGIYLQQAENLYAWIQEDKNYLMKAGLDWRLSDTMPLRCSALNEAQTMWMSGEDLPETVELEWKLKFPEAYELRSIIIHSFRYAFRKHPEIIAQICKLGEIDGPADLIKDLNDLVALGFNNPIPLQSISFNMNKLKIATNLSNTLSSLLMKAIGDGQEYNHARLIRDKAYTHLKYTVDEIRACGRYVFWRTPHRLNGYIEHYRRIYI